MPKVAKKRREPPVTKPATGLSAPKRGSKGRKAKKQTPSSGAFFVELRDRFENYSSAATAGALVILLVGGLIFWAGGYAGRVGQSLDRASMKTAVNVGFGVNEVTLRGAHNVTHAAVLEALGPILGDSILHLDLADARRRLEDIGWVRSASVSRLLPGTIHVSVKERLPAAVWQIDQSLNLIDANGALIRPVSAYEYSNLPMIVGGGAPAAAGEILSALASEAELQPLIYAIVRVGDRRWNLRLRNGIDIKLPETDFQDAVKALSLLQSSQRTLDQNLEYIDLTDSERVIIKKREGPVDLDALAVSGSETE